jgi:pimeloyl-ACP methyl ester carboxylesterase
MTSAYQPRRTARYEEITVRGLRHRIVRWGPESANPIVLLHGFMDCALTYQFLIDELPIDWSFAAPDWRGFGGSEASADSYWFPDYFADFEAFLSRLVPNNRARVVGHSMGGNVASLYAGIRPDRLEWLVNLEGFGLPRRAPSVAPDRYAEWLDAVSAESTPRVYRQPQELAAILLRKNARLSPERAAFVAAAWLRRTARDTDGWELATDPKHRWPNPVLYRREEAEACWQRATIPVQLMLGELSEYRAGLGVDGTDAAFHAIYRRLTLTVLPNVGHMLHHEDPAAVATAMRTFVAAHQSSS